MFECPKCQSVKIIKSGHHHGKQRYRCKSCGFQFTRTDSRGRPASEQAMAITLYTMGLSLNSIARLFKVSTPAVLRWVRTFAEKIYKKNQNPVRLWWLNLMKCGTICIQKKQIVDLESLLSRYRSTH